MALVEVNLSELDGSDGFSIDSNADFLYFGHSVSSAGDINGDGFDDVILGTKSKYGHAISTVIFGKEESTQPTVEFSDLNGVNGFQIFDSDQYEYGGSPLSVNSAGDINGDGFDDIIIGSFTADEYDTNGNYISNRNGLSYIIFGKADGFGTRFEQYSLDGTTGFALIGSEGETVGNAVSGAGDVNGDGFNDIIIGASGASPNGKLSAGKSYIVFGKANSFDNPVELANLDGINGFAINGIDPRDKSGTFVSDAGDINGDGFDDVIIGIELIGINNDNNIAESYIVFGKGDGFNPTLELADLNGSNGFLVSDGGTSGFSRSSVSDAGDVNGDGFDDIIIGMTNGWRNRQVDGEVYLIFGKAGGFSRVFNPSSLDGVNGVRIVGRPDDITGFSVSGLGDVNGDEFDDIIIGSLESRGGRSYVLLGQASFSVTLDLANSSDVSGWTLTSSDYSANAGYSVSGAGDFNGDGLNDIVIGSPESGSSVKGQSYIVFGKKSETSENERVSGTKNDDILTGTLGDDTLQGFTGNDLIRSLRGMDSVQGFSGDDTLIGGVGQDTLKGNVGNDKMFGGIGSDWLYGGAGDDYIQGDTGSDKLFGGFGKDILKGRAGKDFLEGGSGSDLLQGNKDSDTLFGNRGNDLLIGNQSRDRLIGGYGLDTLIGGAAGDKFVFHGTQFGADRIADFNVSNDLILVKQSGFDTHLTIGMLSSAQFAVGNTAIASNTRFIYDDQTGTLLFDADGNGSQAATAIALLNPDLDLTAQNIQVF